MLFMYENEADSYASLDSRTCLNETEICNVSFLPPICALKGLSEKVLPLLFFLLKTETEADVSLSQVENYMFGPQPMVRLCSTSKMNYVTRKSGSCSI